MKRRFQLDSYYTWFATFIVSCVAMVSLLKGTPGDYYEQLACSIGVSLMFLIIVCVSWAYRKATHRDYPILGVKEVLIVLGVSYVVSSISLLFSPEDYWVYAFSIQQILIVSLWVRDTSMRSKDIQEKLG